jgi:hypothetical protein
MLHATKTKAVGNDFPNAYLYVNNSPVNATDPTGLFAEEPRTSDNAEQLATGVNVKVGQSEVTVKATLGNKTVGFDANNKPILGESLIINVSGKGINPKDIDIVQFINRSTDAPGITRYHKVFWDSEKHDVAGERDYAASAKNAKSPTWVVDSVNTKTATATKGYEFAERKDGLTYHDSPKFANPGFAETATLESFIIVNDKIVYKIHWTKVDNAAGQESYPADMRWGAPVDSFPKWALKTLNTDAKAGWIPKQEGSYWKADEVFPGPDFFTKFKNDYDPNPPKK